MSASTMYAAYLARMSEPTPTAPTEADDYSRFGSSAALGL